MGTEGWRRSFLLAATLVIGLSLAAARHGLAQCLQVELACIDCDGGRAYMYSCCPPSGCFFMEIEDGNCNGPALCSYT